MYWVILSYMYWVRQALTDRPSLYIRLERKCKSQKQKKTYYFIHDDMLSPSKQLCDKVPVNGSETSCPVSRETPHPRYRALCKALPGVLVTSMTIVLSKLGQWRAPGENSGAVSHLTIFVTKCYGHNTVQSCFVLHTHAQPPTLHVKKASHRPWWLEKASEKGLD